MGIKVPGSAVEIIVQFVKIVYIPVISREREHLNGTKRSGHEQLLGENFSFVGAKKNKKDQSLWSVSQLEISSQGVACTSCCDVLKQRIHVYMCYRFPAMFTVF